ncbi:MAG: hypothetical protein Q7R88_00620, partial [bacterium]|nr:hypothetical protein [bacterium]
NLIVEPGQEEDWDRGVSEAFMSGLQIQTLYNSKQIGQYSNGKAGTDNYLRQVAGAGGAGLSWQNIILIGLFGSLFMLVSAFVFFAAAILFIIRAIVLIMLMILSPLAFVAWLLPGASGLASKWWSTLWSQAFFAPLYMALAYVVISAINSPGFTGALARGAEQNGFAASITGTAAGSVSIIFNFVILIGLMIGCVIVASALGAHGSGMVMNMGGKLKTMGMGAIGGATGLAGRFAVRGFGTESFKDWALRKSATAKEKAEQASTPGARASLLAQSARWSKVAKSKIIPNLSIRKLDENWERTGGILGGRGAIGSILREQTTKRAVDAKFFGSKSSTEAYEENEKRISKLKDTEYGQEAENGAKKLKDLRHTEHGLQENLHIKQKGLADSRKNLKDAKTDSEKTDAKTKVDKAQAGVEEAKLLLKTFNDEHGAEIEQEMKKIATALARMSTEGFLEMRKDFYTIPEIMDITVLGADKYNALMASDHYTNPEKIEYTEARMERVKTQAGRIREKNEWYLEDKKFWKKEKKEWEEQRKKIAEPFMGAFTSVDAEIKDTEGFIKQAQQELTEAKTPEEKKIINENIASAKTLLSEKREARKEIEKVVMPQIQSREVTAGLIDAGGKSTLRESPKPSKWDNDELRKAMRNMNDPKEIVNYYRYARELIDMPAFVQTVKQGMWSRIRESAEVDSFTKEKIRVDKRLYLQEASDFQFGLDPVMMKRWEKINAVAAQKFRDALNEFVLTHSEQEYKDTYFRDGKLNRDLTLALPPKLLEEFGEGKTSEEERGLRYSTGSELMKEVLQNLANDEATLMSGTLRDLHWIKRELNRGLFGAFKDRDLDVKIPDIEKLTKHFFNAMEGKSEISEGNLDFIIWLVNERAGKEFIPYDQMNEEARERWEAIKIWAKNRDDAQPSRFRDDEEAFAEFERKGVTFTDRRNPFAERGLKKRK